MFKEYDPFCKSEMTDWDLPVGRCLTKMVNNYYNYSKIVSYIRKIYSKQEKISHCISWYFFRRYCATKCKYRNASLASVNN